MDTLAPNLSFCSNPECDLHVSPGDARVRGHGNWAELPDGVILGRGLYDGRFYCDRCGTALIRAGNPVSHSMSHKELVEQQSLPLEFAA
jgi:hypothetical protein